MAKRLVVLAVALLLAGGLAHAGDTMEAEGTVKSVSGNSLAVAGEHAEWTFDVNSKTVVKAQGASHKMKDLDEAGAAATLAEFVKVDQKVTVQYAKENGKTWAAEIRVH
jgi:hypothetical protein